MRIMPCVTNLIENKLSLFKTNSVKLFYILCDRLHCYANASSDYPVFIISILALSKFDHLSFLKIHCHGFACLRLFNYKLHT